MKTVGIIAEYNPFHNGHRYQIEQARKLTNADYVIVVMSGSFVQRGTPAWTDKYLRAQMALDGGADMVFALPTAFATASAETFAFGGVSLLHQLGFVDALCFGSECGDIEKLWEAARFLASPDQTFEDAINHLVQTGLSYPAARAKAFSTATKQSPELLEKPNNILGIEYLKALLKLHSRITPVTLSRADHGYHETMGKDKFLSASGIRAQYEQSGMLPVSYLPSTTSALLSAEHDRFPLVLDDFSTMLYYRLATCSACELSSYADVSQALAMRIQNLLPQYTNASDFVDLLKTKQYTHSRISRALTHILLGIRPEHTKSATPYADLLGFRDSASTLLRSVEDFTVITKKADALFQFNKLKEASASYARAHWNIDLLADNLYQQCLLQKTGMKLPDRYHASLIRK